MPISAIRIDRRSCKKSKRCSSPINLPPRGKPLFQLARPVDSSFAQSRLSSTRLFRRHVMRRTILVAICLTIVLGHAGNPAMAFSPSASCNPSPVDLSGLPEIHGTAANAELWALVFRSVPLHAEQEVKIVWRMTGSGDFNIYAVDSNGNGVLPIWGP